MQGSTWHKWDLHYHTQSSYDYKCKNKDNQCLVDELVSNNVSAVVVTDHHRIDFNRIAELNNLAAGKIIFLRGIEITSELGGSESVHFIAIFPENLENDEIRDEFLAPLGITEEKTSRNTDLYCSAISYKDFLFRAKSIGAIVTVHAGKKSNSIENIANWCKTKKDFKKRLLEDVDILETSKKEDIRAYKEIVFKNIGKECPIVVCSDYHSELGYGEYTDNSTSPPTISKRDSTWIKSDLTFEGLKQIIFEPQLRVRVQENDPSTEKFGLKIESLKITRSKLFNQAPIRFNPDMIAVIGEKGAGKTALLDMVAYALGSQQGDSSSFLCRASNELKSCAISFNLYGDSMQEIFFNNSTDSCRCKYINPATLSSLCEDDSAMQRFIKSIIVHSDIETESTKIADRILDIQSNILKIRNLDSQLDAKEQLLLSIKDLKEKIEIEEKNKPELPIVNDSINKKFGTLGDTIEKEKKELISLQSKHAKLVSFNSEKEQLLLDGIEIIRKSLHEDIADVIRLDDFIIHASYDDDTIKKLNQLEQETNDRKESIREQLKKDENEFASIKATVFKNKETQERYEKWQGYIFQLKEELKGLQKKEETLQALTVDRENLFSECIKLFCENIRGKQRIFKYYSDLKENLSSRIGNIEKNKITFTPALKVDKVRLLEGLEQILSLKAINEDTLKTKIESVYQRQCEKLLNIDCDLTENVAALVQLVISPEAKKNLFEKDIANKSFKAGHNVNDLYKVAFSDFININYNIAFNGIPMDQLSSGQKGIVLLKLLLRLENSTEPLLIDQPEDNLDNKSVYDQLVEEFKLIKQKRQLIIATHNPNLVINTDSEQIIVAEYRRNAKDGYISYSSGAIENPEIREKICKILEGGKEAFINREKRYSFKKQ